MAEAARRLTLERLPELEVVSARPRRRALARFTRNRVAVLGALIVGVFAVLAMLAPILAPKDPFYMEGGIRLSPPTSVHWLGTDEYGRDILSRLLFGAQISFAIAVSATAVSAFFGLPLGLIAGYYGGWRDRGVAAFIEVLFAFPMVLLAIGIVAMMGPGLRNVILAIGIVLVPSFTRVVRGAALAIRNEQYVEAARAMGASDLRVVLRHVLPNMIAPIVVQASLIFSYSITAEASLSFLGVGNQPPTPSWGLMLRGTYGYLEQAPTAAIFPGLAITAVVLGFNLIGDGLRDLLDPKQSQS